MSKVEKPPAGDPSLITQLALPITSKDEIRNQVLALRNTLGAAERNDLSERAIQRLLALEAHRKADLDVAEEFEHHASSWIL
jgi:hypothetical protein